MKEIVSQSLFVSLRFHAVYLFLFAILQAGSAFADSPDREPIRTPLWGGTGHRIINLKAAMHLPASMSALRADSMFFYSHASDADNRKDTSGASFFAESWRHYIDIDIYPDFHNLSHDLNTVISQYGSSYVRSNGTNPWAVVMMLDSLVAQLRRHDTTDAIQTMADIGHYVGDAHQPLHCTDNYDGGLTGNNGIHSRYETSMINSNQSSLTIAKDTAEYIASPIDYIFDIIYHSNSLVDSIMAADNYAKTASGWTGGSFTTAYYTALWQKCGAFTKDQFQRATVALASFWYTASVRAQSSYQITASSGANGSISPSGILVVSDGGSQRFTFDPDSGYHVDSVIVDGSKVDSIAGYTFSNVSTVHSIYVSFAATVNMYTIGATAGPNGTITPSGLILVAEGGSKRFTFEPSTGYHIDSVIVDGALVDSIAGYTFNNVNAVHDIRIAYAINTYVITSAAGAGGTITPTPDVTVNYGASQIFVVTPGLGYQIDSILVDEVYAGNTSPDTVKNVTSAHTIRCVFGVSQITTMHITVADKWNLVSVPLRVSDYTKTALYPDAVSDAFAYQGTYNAAATLTNGIGYWMKFSGEHSIPVTGYPMTSDTISLAAGWNMIGALSSPMPVTDILTDTPGLTVSQFYGYSNGYVSADTLRPGFGYWVKADISGQIILSSSTASFVSRIQLRRTNERPPSPPGHSMGNEVPEEFRLEQNYPNPFNPGTVIQYQLPADAYVSLKVYNTLGQEVALLAEGQQTAGYKSVKFENAALPSGVYVCRLEATSDNNPAHAFTQIKKMALIK